MINVGIYKVPFLIAEARRWVGFTEVGGNNNGQLVEMWQKSVDDISGREPWCMCFIQAQVAWTDHMFQQLFSNTNFTRMVKSELCSHVWYKTPRECRSMRPLAGSVAIWQKRKSMSGHTGLVSRVAQDGLSFMSIEGNTSSGNADTREGDGVHEKLRTLKPIGELELRGFVMPWSGSSSPAVLPRLPPGMMSVD